MRLPGVAPVLAICLVATACTAQSAGSSDLGDRGGAPTATIVPSSSRCTTDAVAATLDGGPPASRPASLSGVSADEAIAITTVLGHAAVAFAAAGLGEQLRTPDVTILAPTDCAVVAAEGVFDGWLAAPSGALRVGMSHHIVLDGRLSLQELADRGEVVTAAGEVLDVGVDETGRLVLDGVGTVVLADLQTSNAVIHLVDTLLVPPSLRASPDG